MNKKYLSGFFKINIIFFLVLFLGCEDQPTVTGVASTAATSTSGTSTSTTAGCTTRVADYGKKLNLTGATSGLSSDIKLIPSTSYPAMAYSDTSASLIKFSYWNGSRFITEAVAGDVIASITFVSLAFLSSGVPIVAWTNGGTTTRVAIRSAAYSSSGTWSAASVDAATQSRAVRVVVDPNDNVFLTHVTHTTSGVLKFVYCKTPCTSASSFVPMATAENIHNAAIVDATVHTGLTYCKLTGQSVYYPAVTYGATGGQRYAVCQQSDLANCLVNGNWTKQIASATATAVASDIYLDPSVDGDQPKIVFKNAATTALTLKMTGGSLQCDGAVGAFTSGATLTTGTMASQFIKLLKTSNDRYHVIANNGTTSMVYFNSQSSDVNGAWNGVGTIETATTTLQAGTGGAVVNASTGQIYTSYGVAAGSFSMHMGIVDDYTIASNGATARYTRILPDLHGYFQLLASPGKSNATATSSTGLPGMAYIDYPGGAISAAAGSTLNYAIRSGTSLGAAWIPYTIPGTGTPYHPSLGYDSNGYPWVGYFEGLAGNLRYYLLKNTNVDGSGIWSAYVFPFAPAAAAAAFPAANHTALAMYYSSGSSTPVMVVIDNSAASRTVRAARLNSTTGVWSSVQTLKTITTVAGASSLTTDYDSSGNIVVSFYDHNTTKLNYTYSTDGGATWATVFELSAAGTGQGAAIRINPVTGKPAVAYYGKSTNRVYYASCSGTIATCATGGWSPVEVDVTAGVSGLAATTDELLQVSLEFDSSGLPLIAYTRGPNSDGKLILQRMGSSGTFTATTLNGTAVGNFMTAATGINYAVGGWSVTSTKNTSGERTYHYVGPGNWLYATSCND